MEFLSGEFECKLDPKSRMMLPSGLKKKLPELETEGFVINRGPGKFLQMYTAQAWKEKLNVLHKLNEYNKDHLTVIRYIMDGATEFLPDALGRIVLPKFLRTHAGIEGDVTIVLLANRIEVWGTEQWQELRRNEREDIVDLLQNVLGSTGGATNG